MPKVIAKGYGLGLLHTLSIGLTHRHNIFSVFGGHILKWNFSFTKGWAFHLWERIASFFLFSFFFFLMIPINYYNLKN
jgi:hypothetical protein